MMLFFAAVPLSGSGSHMLDDYIAGIAAGDREALAGLYRETHTAVYGFALSLCANAHDAAGMKHREIASLLHLPLPTVLSKYNRALKKLREAMKEVL